MAFETLSTDVALDAAMLSLHFWNAGDHERTYRYALLAAERADRAHASAEAAVHYDRAVDAARRVAQVDDTVIVGQVLAEIDPNGSGNGAAPAASSEDGPGMTAAGTGEGDADIGEVAGDRVRLEMSPYDITRGRINFRHLDTPRPTGGQRKKYFPKKR